MVWTITFLSVIEVFGGERFFVRTRLIILFLFCLAGLFVLFRTGFSPDSNSQPTLRVFTYSSFQSHYGPGPALVEEFEKVCQCKVHLINAGDAGVILQRLKLQGKTPVDLVIGLDQFTSVQSLEELQWQKVKLPKISWDPLFPKEDTTYFVPYDWSPMTFIYKRGDIKPANSLKELLEPRFKNQISLQDPRMSTPGLQFLMWVIDQYGEPKGLEYFSELTKSIFRISSSWTSAYGLFKRQQARVVFSYLTSPVYHWTQENDDSYQPMVFDEGHPVQIEMAAIPENCTQCRLAHQFIEFLLSKKAQRLLMNKNYMLPVIEGVVQETVFEKLPQVKIRPQKNTQQLFIRRKKLLEGWYKSVESKL